MAYFISCKTPIYQSNNPFVQMNLFKPLSIYIKKTKMAITNVEKTQKICFL